MPLLHSPSDGFHDIKLPPLLEPVYISWNWFLFICFVTLAILAYAALRRKRIHQAPTALRESPKEKIERLKAELEQLLQGEQVDESLFAARLLELLRLSLEVYLQISAFTLTKNELTDVLLQRTDTESDRDGTSQIQTLLRVVQSCEKTLFAPSKHSSPRDRTDLFNQTKDFITWAAQQVLEVQPSSEKKQLS